MNNSKNEWNIKLRPTPTCLFFFIKLHTPAPGRFLSGKMGKYLKWIDTDICLLNHAPHDSFTATCECNKQTVKSGWKLLFCVACEYANWILNHWIESED